jgi:hypothetical protein
MPWFLNARGSATTADDEQFVIDDLRQALTTDAAGSWGATLKTSFHGEINLLAPADDEDDAAASDEVAEVEAVASDETAGSDEAGSP